jgi:metal-sulfur cluster biosynthetic enzyme
MAGSEPNTSAAPSLPPVDWLVDGPDAEGLTELLREVIDPELGVNIVDLGLVYEVALSAGGVARIRMTMTTPGCPLTAYLDDAVHDALAGLPGVVDVDLRVVWDPPWSPEMMSDAAKHALGWRR